MLGYILKIDFIVRCNGIKFFKNEFKKKVEFIFEIYNYYLRCLVLFYYKFCYLGFFVDLLLLL